GPISFSSSGIFQIWWVPAMAMNRSVLWTDNAQGLLSSVVAGGPTNRLGGPATGAPGTQPGKGLDACSPVPAIVFTVFALRSTFRSMWFSLSATYSVSPFSAHPCGWLNVAV